MRPRLTLVAIALVLGGCAPKALYFHESTKVAFAADYNTSDTQPLATSFGYKRRIVAVVPAQERNIPEGGTERNGTNSGEALSLVSKFNVRAGREEGMTITNNFASGMAARIMTHSAGSPESLNVLMHSAPISVSSTTGETSAGRPAAEVVNERIARIMGKRTRDVPPSRRTIDATPDGGMGIRKPIPKIPPSTRSVDLDENGEARIVTPKKNGAKLPELPKKNDVPASTRSVDLTPDGEAVIKKR